MHRFIPLFMALVVTTSAVSRAEEISVTEELTVAKEVSAAEQPWHLKINDALNLAKQQQRPMVISIEIKGCIYCEMMRSDTWTDSKIDTSVRKNFVALRLFKDDQAKLVKTLKLKRFPATVVYSATGKLIAKKEGLMFAGECREWIQKAEDELNIVTAEALVQNQ